MAKTKGELYLIPNTLGGESVSDILAANVSTIVSPLRYFAVEDLKSARRLLRKVDRTFPIDESTFFILPRSCIIWSYSKPRGIETIGSGID